MNPERYRGSQGRIAEFPAALGSCRHVLAAGTLAGFLLACAPAQAQTADIEDRIEATFDLLLGNPAELAVPLTRRALVRRSAEGGSVAPLPYRQIEDVSAQQEADAIEEGSAEDATEIARLPRPRPIVISEATASADLIGQPLDLVAGAAAAPPANPEKVAAVEPVAPAAPAAPAAVVAAPAAVAEPAPAAEPAASPTPREEAVALIPAATAGIEPAPELVAAEACLSIGDVTDRDGDFKRNADVLSGFCIAEEKFKERKRPWIIQTVTSRKAGPLWAVMHDDEDVSFDNAVKALKEYGGTLITVETGGKRNLSGVDPNRNFSAEGIGCRKLGDDASPRYTGFFRDLIDPSQPIVALHNNTKERIPTGGLGHVSMNLVPKSMRSSPAPDSDGPLAGDHALVLLAASDLDDPMAANRAAVLNGKGINVVLERVQKDRGDCSLSNFAVLIDNPNYFNVTVGEEKGEGDKQMQIIETLMSGRSDTVASQ